jgi:hypothetical protein
VIGPQLERLPSQDRHFLRLPVLTAEALGILTAGGSCRIGGLSGPGSAVAHLSVPKSVHIVQGKRIAFRAEAANVLNRVKRGLSSATPGLKLSC